jgi:hypothetical protein
MSDHSFIAFAAAGRRDIYGPIHKGLRLAQADMLGRLGRADFAGGAEVALLADLRHLLDLGAKHLAHEEAHLHPALEARRPGATASLEVQHDHHRARFEMLDAAIRAVEAASPADRPGLGRALYLAFTGFVAEDLEHMRQEETETWPQLCALFDDEELMAIHTAIVDSLSPGDRAENMRAMLLATNPAERRALLDALQANAPPEAYAAMVAVASMTPDGWRAAPAAGPPTAA